MAGCRQAGDDGGRTGASALRHLFDHERRGVVRARPGYVRVLGPHPPAAPLPLPPAPSRARIQGRRGARNVEFSGCTEAAPHVGRFSCAASQGKDGRVTTHLLEDVQVWEVIDPDTRQKLPDGARGLTVCTSLNSESSPQLRFLVGDYTVLDRTRCTCGRTHPRAVAASPRRANTLLNLPAITMSPHQSD